MNWVLKQQEKTDLKDTNKDLLENAEIEINRSLSQLSELKENPLQQALLEPLRTAKEGEKVRYQTLSLNENYQQDPSLAFNNPLTILEYLIRVKGKISNINSAEEFVKHLTSVVGGKEDPYSKRIESYSEIFEKNKGYLVNWFKEAYKKAKGNTKIALSTVLYEAKVISSKNEKLNEDEVTAAIMFQLLLRNGGFALRYNEDSTTDPEIIKARLDNCFNGLIRGMDEGWVFNTAYGGYIAHTLKNLTRKNLINQDNIKQLISDEGKRETVYNAMKNGTQLAVVVDDLKVENGDYNYTVKGIILRNEGGNGLQFIEFDRGRLKFKLKKERNPANVALGLGQLSPEYVKNVYTLQPREIELLMPIGQLSTNNTYKAIKPPEAKKPGTYLQPVRQTKLAPITGTAYHEVLWTIKEKNIKEAAGEFYNNGILITYEGGGGNVWKVFLVGENYKGVVPEGVQKVAKIKNEQYNKLVNGEKIDVTLVERGGKLFGWLYRDIKTKIQIKETNEGGKKDAHIHFYTKYPMLGSKDVKVSYELTQNTKDTLEVYKTGGERLQLSTTGFSTTVRLPDIVTISEKNIKVGINEGLTYLYEGIGGLELQTKQRITNDLFKIFFLKDERQNAAGDLYNLFIRNNEALTRFLDTIYRRKTNQQEKDNFLSTLNSLKNGDSSEWNYIVNNSFLSTIRKGWEDQIKGGEGSVVKWNIPVVTLGLYNDSIYLNDLKSQSINAEIGVMLLKGMGYNLGLDENGNLSITPSKSKNIKDWYAKISYDWKGQYGELNISAGKDPKFSEKPIISTKINTATLMLGRNVGVQGIAQLTSDGKTSMGTIAIPLFIFDPEKGGRVEIIPHYSSPIKGDKKIASKGGVVAKYITPEGDRFYVGVESGSTNVNEGSSVTLSVIDSEGNVLGNLSRFVDQNGKPVDLSKVLAGYQSKNGLGIEFFKYLNENVHGVGLSYSIRL